MTGGPRRCLFDHAILNVFEHKTRFETNDTTAVGKFSIRGGTSMYRSHVLTEAFKAPLIK